MSIKLMTAIWYTEFIDLPTGEKHDDGKEKFVRSTSAKITLLAIADQANDEGESAYPGYTRLELKTGLSRQGVADVIKALRYNGIVETSEKPSKLNTNDYKINLSCFPRLKDENARILVVNSLDQSSHLTSDSQATLPEVVKPLDLKHTLNQQETSKPKGDMVDFELGKLKAKSIRDAISEYFRLNVKWDVKYSREWLEWAHDQNITAEQIARAADTWRMDKQFNWQVPTLKGIFEKWQMLMDASRTPEERKEASGYYA